METQTRFDLNIAIENWRAELTAQSNLTTEARRELETHLRDSMAGLRAHGLDDAEAFWVARKRVGKPGQLGEEFIKADPTSVWRERVFWMVLAGLFVWLWNASSAIIGVIIPRAITNFLIYENWRVWNHPLVDFGLQTLPVLIRVLPICWLAFFLAKGSLNAHSRLVVFFRSRSRLATFSLVWILLNSCIEAWSAWEFTLFQNSHMKQAIDGGPITTFSYPVLPNLILNLSFPIVFLVLLTWLMPARLQAKPQTA